MGYVLSIIGDQEAADSKSMLGLESATTIKPSIKYVWVGMEGEETAAATFNTLEINRFTGAGSNTTVVPILIDPDDPGTPKSSGGSNHTSEPTKTAGAVVLRFSYASSLNPTFQWYNPPGCNGLIAPATASNGLVLLFTKADDTLKYNAQFIYTE